MMGAMAEESVKYSKYARQNRKFYRKVAKKGRQAYNKLGNETEAAYEDLGSDLLRGYARTAKGIERRFANEGEDAYNRYYDDVSQDLRTTGYEGMMGILNNPSGVRDDAAYKFMQNEAETSTARAAGARGMGNSSNVMNALQERRLNVADTYLNSIMNRYGAAFGLGETARTQGLEAQDQYTSAGLNLGAQTRVQGRQFQGQALSQGVAARANLRAQGLDWALKGRVNAQAAYQGMLDQGSNLRVGQGAISVNNALAQNMGAAKGAPLMALGQGLSTVGSMGMMGGFGGGGSGGTTAMNTTSGMANYSGYA
jgi:hypothetical protein